jgi:hypothetical protein
VVDEAEVLDLVGGQEPVLGNEPQHLEVALGQPTSQHGEEVLADTGSDGFGEY